ncbi:MAG: transporter [Burkholderiales bacterium]
MPTPTRTRAARSAALAVLVVLSLARPAPACDTGSCPMLTQSQDSVRTRGSFGVDVAFRTMAHDRYVGRSGATSALVDFENGRVIGGHHRDASMSHELLQLDVSYGLSQKLTLFSSLPILNRRAHGHYEFQTVEGGPIEHEHGPIPPGRVLSDQELVHRKSGLGDVQLGGTYAVLWSARESLVARAALELPTGEYRGLDVWGYIDRPDVQAGSGSWDAIGSLQYQRSVALPGLGLMATGMYRLNGENSLGYQFGDDASFGFGVTYSKGPRFRWSAQFAWRFVGEDAFRGQTVPATGLTTLSVVPGIRVGLTGRSVLYTYLKIPIATGSSGSPLAPTLDLAVGLGTRF